MLARPLCLLIPALGGLLAGCAAESHPGALQTGAVPLPAIVAPSPGSAVRGTPVVPGRPARVFVMAGIGAGCKPTGPPTMAIDRQPAKGTVTFQPGQETTIQYSVSGQCVGSRVPGTGIYYVARAGAKGGDTFTVSARMGTGEVATRTFAVQIAE